MLASIASSVTKFSISVASQTSVSSLFKKFSYIKLHRFACDNVKEYEELFIFYLPLANRLRWICFFFFYCVLFSKWLLRVLEQASETKLQFSRFSHFVCLFGRFVSHRQVFQTPTRALAKRSRIENCNLWTRWNGRRPFLRNLQFQG